MKKLVFLAAVLALLLSSLSCAAQTEDPLDVVMTLSEKEISLPVGRIYHSSAPEGSESYLSNEMLSSVYGIPTDYEGILSAAARLSSFSHPCELAVFLCKNTSSAEDVALFFRERVDTLTREADYAASFCGLSTEEYLEYVRNAAVIISGRYVALIISSDTAAARKLLYSVL